MVDGKTFGVDERRDVVCVEDVKERERGVDEFRGG